MHGQKKHKKLVARSTEHSNRTDVHNLVTIVTTETVVLLVTTHTHKYTRKLCFFLF